MLNKRINIFHLPWVTDAKFGKREYERNRIKQKEKKNRRKKKTMKKEEKEEEEELEEGRKRKEN